MNRKIVLSFIAFTIVFVAFGQNNSAIDSLENILKTAKADKAKVDCLNALSDQYQESSYYETSCQYAESALELAQTLGHKKSIAANCKKDVVSGPFDIPPGVSGQTRMRITIKKGGAPIPCETFKQGEVEDYTVNFGTFKHESISRTYIKDLTGFPNPENGSFHGIYQTGDAISSNRTTSYSLNIMFTKNFV